MDATHAGHSHPAMHHDPSAAELALKLAEQRRAQDVQRLHERRTWAFAAGRMLLSALFICAGAAKLATFGDTKAALLERGLGGAGFVLPIGIAVELILGTLLAVGLWVRKAALAVLFYLFAVSAVVHWDVRVPANREVLVYHLALAGALLLLVAHGGGRISFDHWLASQRERRA